MIARALPAEGRLFSVGDTVLDLYALDGSDSSTRHLLHPRADCNVEEGPWEDDKGRPDEHHHGYACHAPFE